MSDLPAMIVMPTNNSARFLRWMSKRYPGTLGHLYSPEGKRGPFEEFPHALDNGCFKRWDPPAFKALLEWAHTKSPQPAWVVVPDVVGNWPETVARWPGWARWIRATFGFSLAIAVQDGATVESVSALSPPPDVIFVGGSTKWKWETAARWCASFPRVHIGRVNSPLQLWECEGMGAESCDGTGWMRGNRKQKLGLVQFVRGNRPTKFQTMFPDKTHHAND